MRRYLRHATAYMLGIYACLALGLLGIVEMVWVTPILALCYGRGALLIHELMHVRSAQRVNILMRLMMLFDTPVGLGYAEYQNIHLRHHRFNGDPRDPERYQIEGPHIRAALGALFSSEVALVTWLRERGLQRSLARQIALRGALFALLLWINPGAFLVYWLAMRLIIAGANLAFHHVVHFRGGALGHFRFQTTALVDGIVAVALGPSLSPVLFDHPAHHAWPRVRADRLTRLLDRFPPPQRPGAHTP